MNGSNESDPAGMEHRKRPGHGIYGRYLFPYLEILATSRLKAIRRRLISNATGNVIEIGAGAGQNIPFLPDAIDSYLAVEPSPVMIRKAGRRAAKNGLGERPLRIIEGMAERLPCADESMDTAISFLVLCSVSDPSMAMSEIYRVLKPGGRLLFFEHVLSSDPRVKWVQKTINPLWKRVGCGCHLTRDTASGIMAAGFEFDRLERYRSSKMGPSITDSVIEGSAVKP